MKTIGGEDQVMKTSVKTTGYAVKCRLLRRARVVATLVGLWAMSATTPVSGYSGSEHIRFPDQAYQILNILNRGGFYSAHAAALDPVGAMAGLYPPFTAGALASCPADTCPGGQCNPIGNDWARFVAQAIAAPAKLDNLTTDLFDPVLPASVCGGVFPALSFGHLAQCRAGELPFPPRRNWGNNKNECFLRRGYIVGGADQNPDQDVQGSGPVLPFYQNLITNYTGSVLGEWATAPDDAVDDTHVWFRPSNILLLSDIKGIAEGIADAGLTTGLLGFCGVLCLADAIFSGGDCLDDVISFSHTVDPLSLADEYIGWFEQASVGQLVDLTAADLPGSLPLPGLWHFATINRSFPGGQFNKIPGIKFISGGVGGLVDGVDQSIISITALTGLTVQSDTSQGVANYSPFADGDFRSIGDWIDPTLGHVEFEPVQNLAQYGWQKFRTGQQGARGFGWVLHAIGDAGQPHHTISAVGWGHPEWERFANLSWQTNFQEQDLRSHYTDLVKVLQFAFRWWCFLDSRQAAAGPGSDLAVGDMIRALATETYGLPISAPGGAFQLGLSGTSQASDPDIHTAYDSKIAAMGDLMRRAIGASAGFLVKASDFVPTPVLTTPCSCASGSSRLGRNETGTFIQATDGICHACGQDLFLALPLLVDGVCVATCPPNKPTQQGGTCTTAGACPPETPLAKAGGACVAQCASAEFVVNNFQCQAACPPGQTADAAHFCVPSAPLPPAPPSCSGALRDSSGGCCLPKGATCGGLGNLSCCSGSCDIDGLCRGVPGDACVAGKDCVSTTCSNGICAAGNPSQPCVKNSDCASNVCGSLKTCLGISGDPCFNASECALGYTCVQSSEGGDGICTLCQGMLGSTCDPAGLFCCVGECIGGICSTPS